MKEMSWRELGMGEMEGRVYWALLEIGPATGYQVAKRLGVTRPSVYAALDSLFGRDLIHKIPGGTNSFLALDPELLIQRVQERTNEASARLREATARLNRSEEGQEFVNIQNQIQLQDYALKIIDKAQKEILINTDFDLADLESSLQVSQTRGVRVVFFSFREYPNLQLPEIYGGQAGPNCQGNLRLMLVRDHSESLIGGLDAIGDFRGVHSHNPLMVDMVSEHIHHDIYFYLLSRKTQGDLIPQEIKIWSMMEKKREK